MGTYTGIPPTPMLDQIEVNNRPWSPTGALVFQKDNSGCTRLLPPLAVVGTGPGWEYEAESIPDECDILVVNRAGCELTWRPVKWWATMHPEFLADWTFQRMENGGNLDIEIVAPFQSKNKEHMILNISPKAGTSGLYGVLVGLVNGYRDIRLYGVPLEGRDDMDGGLSVVHEQWERLFPILTKYVTAPCPGWTRRLFHKK
ncbi:hypothetical protein SYK_02840 [Pseudodesulfovibrio nedwellii]|uniref:Uncharacterized protein n=1 Tax=Pseudodesulfovibrio nedwellii TaxID=2973072 RepID=A0ABM8AWS6_9BACT|nr:hypothetical protein [Pseudodesulfovibrio nedwellii]BDQ35924.1 hypothetical protein SYK_02840 [Pseudodesulfovibrio nedwellii]